jgi:hypothetical protein
MDIPYAGIALEAEDFTVSGVDWIDGPFIAQGQIGKEIVATAIGLRSSPYHGYSLWFKKEIHI